MSRVFVATERALGRRVVIKLLPDEARVADNAALELDPQNVAANWNAGAAYAFAGRPDSAVIAIERTLKASSGAFGLDAIAAFVYASAGRWDQAGHRRSVALALKSNSPHYLQAVVSMAFSEYDAAVDAVERGVRGREPLFSTILVGL